MSPNNYTREETSGMNGIHVFFFILNAPSSLQCGFSQLLKRVRCHTTLQEKGFEERKGTAKPMNHDYWRV